MDHDAILELIDETIHELETAIQAKPKARAEFEKSEFGVGYRIIDISDFLNEATA